MAVRRLAEKQPKSFAFSKENLEWVKGQVAKYPEGREASAVIPLLDLAQRQVGAETNTQGWLPIPVMEFVARELGMSYVGVLEVATFYTMFNLEPVGKFHVQVCGTTPCMLRGSDDVVAACKKHIHAHPHTVSADGKFSWMEVECLGACVNAPMLQIGKDFYEDLDGPKTEALLEAFRRGETPKPGAGNGRHTSEPEGGALTLTDPQLYNGGYSRKTNGAGATTDAEAKKPTEGASDREAPVQKPPGAAT